MFVLRNLSEITGASFVGTLQHRWRALAYNLSPQQEMATFAPLIGAAMMIIQFVATYLSPPATVIAHRIGE